ncbi:hypothetical protein MSG28_004512 [Choristoneura fumiferana]|uniref:Uncharacterized protein n=1 Tax=Choristoneura fumiferana TaxID=7141 RepID=A0ACC0K6E0_CHOFU|nr:hypothetical protein MSG28_004512 [Choristoneura fumiferana]
MWEEYIPSPVVQVYLILLTRSEAIKLRKENLGVQFVNNAADAESICVQKSPKLMKMYFVYGVVVVILIFASTSAMIYDDVQRAVSTWDTSYNGFADIAIRVVATPAMCFVDIFIYIYVLFLVRSERIKLLEQNLEIQFVNNGAEAESYCVCVADAATCARDDHGSSLKATDALCDA